MAESTDNLEEFAKAFKSYMGIMPLVTAALAPLLTFLKAIPVYQSQKNPVRDTGFPVAGVDFLRATHDCSGERHQGAEVLFQCASFPADRRHGHLLRYVLSRAR